AIRNLKEKVLADRQRLPGLGVILDPGRRDRETKRLKRKAPRLETVQEFIRYGEIAIAFVGKSRHGAACNADVVQVIVRELVLFGRRGARRRAVCSALRSCWNGAARDQRKNECGKNNACTIVSHDLLRWVDHRMTCLLPLLLPHFTFDLSHERMPQ